MKKGPPQIMLNEIALSDAEFMKTFNENMPAGYPHVTPAILEKFKLAHANLFKGKGMWTLDQHRKRMIEWLPQNI